MLNNTDKGDHALLKLDAITLHGIGSYREGARLNIRPLTLLCGANGSGKSTWLTALDLLSRSQTTLPLAFDVEDDEIGELTNVCITQGFFEGQERPGSASDFGPPGTIGLEFMVTEDFTLDGLSGSDKTLKAWFAQARELRNGTKVLIRLAHLRDGMFDAQDYQSECQDFMELRIEDTTFQFWRSFKDDNHQLWANLGQTQSGKLVKLGDVKLEGRGSVMKCFACCNMSQEQVAQIARVAMRWMSDLLDRFFRGYFYLSAVRVKHRYKSLNAIVEKTEDDVGIAVVELNPCQKRKRYLEINKRRYVGPGGEATLAIQKLFALSPMSSSPGSQQTVEGVPLVTEAFVSTWLDRLINISILRCSDTLPHLALSEPWMAEGLIPNGVLKNDRPVVDECFGRGTARMDVQGRVIHKISGGDAIDLDASIEDGSTSFRHRVLLNVPATPGRLSAGFHQIAPMIVQSAVMLRDEVLGIENPEVHLHPSLQIDIAEFLIRQAASGRTLIIETHSDLIVRRVIREILEESIPLGQEKVRIYFTEIVCRERGGEYYSVLNPLRVNEAGQIENWPKGFLDDDVRESQRLLDIMYGSADEEEDDE